MRHWFAIPRVPILWKSNIIVFVSSFCVMVIELIAARILAPHIGVSLYTWTSIISTILLSIALGNYIGGKIADKYASPLVLGAIFLVSSLTTIGILPATKEIASAYWLTNMPAMLEFTLKTCFIFFLPAFILSMVSPLAIKLALADLGKTGGVVGTIYAISTAGAIIGTLMTGFYFILWFGLQMIVWLIAGVLILTGTIICLSWKIPNRRIFSLQNIVVWIVIIVTALTAISLFQFRDNWQEHYTKESNYFSIQVRDIDGKSKMLILDHFIHSIVTPSEPTTLGYDYLKIFKEIVQYYNADGRSLSTLHLGGGGYSFPRYLEAVYPGSSNEVVEIDPAVTEVAYQELGLSRDTSIKTHNLDARQFLIRRTTEPKYDLIVGDVFNDYSTPYHLTTLEFGRMVKANLVKDGVYLVNVVDDYARGRYMVSIIYTLKHVFNNVYVFSNPLDWSEYGYGRTTYVLVATDRCIDLDDYTRFTTKSGRMVGNPHNEELVNMYLIDSGALLLTDDYVPTDILLAKIQR